MERGIDNRRVINSTILDESCFFLQCFDDQGNKAATAGFREILEMQWYCRNKVLQTMMEFSILDQYGRLNVPYKEIATRLLWGWSLGACTEEWSLYETLCQAIFEKKWLILPDWVKIYPREMIEMALREVADDCVYSSPRLYYGRRYELESYVFIVSAAKKGIKEITVDFEVERRSTIISYIFENLFGNKVALCYRGNTDRVNKALERLSKECPLDLIFYVGMHHKLKSEHKLLFSIIYPSTTTTEEDESA